MAEYHPTIGLEVPTFADLRSAESFGEARVAMVGKHARI
jgi:hypothetical protein